MLPREPGRGDGVTDVITTSASQRTRVQHTLQAIALNHALRQGRALWSATGHSALEALPLPPYTSQGRNTTTPKAMKEVFGGMLRNRSKQTAMPAAA
jgi:hypothetical protein